MTIDYDIIFTEPRSLSVSAYNAVQALGTEEQAELLCKTWGRITRTLRSLGIFACDPILSSKVTQICRVEWRLFESTKNSNLLGTLVFGSDPCLGDNVIPKFWIRPKDESSLDDVHREIFTVNGLQDPLFFYGISEVRRLNRHSVRCFKNV